jgi:hypothetical protein
MSIESDHARALELNEFFDMGRAMAARDNAVQLATPAPCSFRGLISKRPCLLPAGHDEPHDVWGDPSTWIQAQTLATLGPDHVTLDETTETS